MGSKGWLIFIGVTIALLGGLVYMSGRDKVSVDTSSVDVNMVQKATAQNGNIGDHVSGATNGKAVMIQYGDFQCPGCAGVAPTVKQMREKYAEKMTFVFRNMTLPYHQNALAAATTAEAAGLQGKYWEMHDLLYTNQKMWENLNAENRTTTFSQYAEQLGLDMTKYAADIKSDAVKQKISFDASLAKKHNATATPSFFLGGKALSQDTWGKAENFEKAITEALK